MVRVSGHSPHREGRARSRIMPRPCGRGAESMASATAATRRAAAVAPCPIALSTSTCAALRTGHVSLGTVLVAYGRKERRRSTRADHRWACALRLRTPSPLAAHESGEKHHPPSSGGSGSRFVPLRCETDTGDRPRTDGRHKCTISRSPHARSRYAPTSRRWQCCASASLHSKQA